jgi:hypothetical protein
VLGVTGALALSRFCHPRHRRRSMCGSKFPTHLLASRTISWALFSETCEPRRDGADFRLTVSHCALGSEIPGVVRPAFGVTPVTVPMQITR